MTKFKHNFTCILIYSLAKVFSVLGDNVKEVLTCAPSFSESSPKMLQCGDQEVIDIKRARAGYYGYSQCKEKEIISWFNNPDSQYSRCTRNVNLDMNHDCRGNKSCFIQSNEAMAWVLNSCGVLSNVLYIQYECHSFNRRSTLVMGMDMTATGKSIDLLSPNFPCRIQKHQRHSTLCKIDPIHTQNGRDITFSITVKLLNLACDSSLYYKRRNSRQTEYTPLNCLNEDQQTYWETMNKNIKWDIGYRNNWTYGDEKFWISITGWKISDPVELKVFCTDQINNNEYDKDCDLLPISPSTNETTHKTKRKLGAKDILVIVLGVILGILLVVLIVIICLMRRKREGDKDSESTCQGPASPAVNSIGVYAIAGPINEDPVSDKQTNKRKNNYDNVAIVDKSVLYAVPVKTKKTKAEKERKIQIEEGSLKVNAITENKNGVVMSENELYEPCPNTDDSVEENLKCLVRYESLKSNDKENNEEETGDDYQILYENSELYSSSVDLAEDGTELDTDVTYENVPNGINHDSD